MKAKDKAYYNVYCYDLFNICEYSKNPDILFSQNQSLVGSVEESPTTVNKNFNFTYTPVCTYMHIIEAIYKFTD